MGCGKGCEPGMSFVIREYADEAVKELAKEVTLKVSNANLIAAGYLCRCEYMSVRCMIYKEMVGLYSLVSWCEKEFGPKTDILISLQDVLGYFPSVRLPPGVSLFRILIMPVAFPSRA